MNMRRESGRGSSVSGQRRTHPQGRALIARRQDQVLAPHTAVPGRGRRSRSPAPPHVRPGVPRARWWGLEHHSALCEVEDTDEVHRSAFASYSDCASIRRENTRISLSFTPMSSRPCGWRWRSRPASCSRKPRKPSCSRGCRTPCPAWPGSVRRTLKSRGPMRLSTRSGVVIDEGIAGDGCALARLATGSHAVVTRKARDMIDPFIDVSPCS